MGQNDSLALLVLKLCFPSVTAISYGSAFQQLIALYIAEPLIASVFGLGVVYLPITAFRVLYVCLSLVKCKRLNRQLGFLLVRMFLTSVTRLAAILCSTVSHDNLSYIGHLLLQIIYRYKLTLG